MRTKIGLLAAVLLTSACAPQPDPRIDALIDRQAIDQLVAGDYPRALDAHDWDAYVGYFTEDGELSLGPQAAKGHAEMKKLLEGLGDERINHVISNLSYRIEGDAATGGAYWEDIGLVNGAPGVVVAGHYEDALRKVDGQWKFAKRAIVIDFTAQTQAPVAASGAAEGAAPSKAESTESPAEPPPSRQ